jgi:Na+-driven multidrug efflux pump
MYMTLTLFQSTGYAKPAFGVSLLQETVVIPMLVLGTAAMGVSGIAWAVPAGDITAMVIGLILQVMYRKRLYSGEALSIAQRPVTDTAP